METFKQAFKDWYTSVIRTLVPYLVGGILAYLSTRGVRLTDDFSHQLIVGLELAFTGVYYVVVRWLEHLNRRFGWLLGVPKAPKYDHNQDGKIDAADNEQAGENPSSE